MEDNVRTDNGHGHGRQARHDHAQDIGDDHGRPVTHDHGPDQARATGQDHGRDTRSRLRELALQLFAEQGYEKTSLREIAERLGVTKAALYYYFKSKEDIVRSLVEDYYAELDELIAWGKTQPRNAATRAQIVSRYLDIVANGAAVFRMLHQNQAAVSALAAEKDRGALFKERLDSLVDLLTEPGAGLRDQVRAASCLVSISLGVINFEQRAATPGELRAALLDMALELVDAVKEEAPS